MSYWHKTIKLVYRFDVSPVMKDNTSVKFDTGLKGKHLELNYIYVYWLTLIK